MCHDPGVRQGAGRPCAIQAAAKESVLDLTSACQVLVEEKCRDRRAEKLTNTRIGRELEVVSDPIHVCASVAVAAYL